jgi:hypothetical protein
VARYVKGFRTEVRAFNTGSSSGKLKMNIFQLEGYEVSVNTCV